MPPKAIQNLPAHAKEIYESTAEGLRGKTNPRTGKIFTDAERNMIAWNAVKQKYKKVNEKWVKKLEENKMEEKCPEGFEWDSKQNKCVPCPGSKIRSGGKGRGEGYGKGKGPIGVPIGRKVISNWEQLH